MAGRLIRLGRILTVEASRHGCTMWFAGAEMNYQMKRLVRGSTP
jgi:hypothetical protein